METTNADRARSALIGIVEIAERQMTNLVRLTESLHGHLLSKSVSNKVIADRCEDTAKLIERKL